jgi:cathepsin L
LTGNITNLSVQQVVDCSEAFYNEGCDGGIPDWVYDYIMSTGLETDKDYPYIDNEGSCNADLRKYVVGISDYYDVRPESPN